MNKTIRKILLLSFALILISLSACSSKYVCYDGTVEKNVEDCPIIETTTIVQRQAENAVDSYSSAYAIASGDSPRRINTYREGAHWYSEVIFTNTRLGTVNHVTLKVDGKTSSVSCVEGCNYLIKEEIEEQTNQNITNNTI